MIRKILGRIAAVRPFAFAALALASFTASAFDTPYLTSYDITEFLDIPAADANGVINLGDATVKDAIVEEVLDPEEGAVLVLTRRVRRSQRRRRAQASPTPSTRARRSMA